MANWYWKENDERRGPVSSKELMALAAAQHITPQTLILKEGASEWVSASKVKGLFEPPSSRESSPPSPEPTAASANNGSVFGAARDRAALLMQDLRALNWREEVLPIDESNLRLIARDYVFWTVLLIGVLPQLIGTVENVQAQLSLYACLFAAVWGVVFRDFIVRSPAKWSWLIASAVFTATIGIAGIFFVGRVLPLSYLGMSHSSNIFTSLLGFVVQTGAMEELCKAVPVLAYLILKRHKAEPFTALLIGVFSGLGFAASENLLSGEAIRVHELSLLKILLRSLSTVLGHAVLSGIVAYFLVMAFLTKRRAPVLALIGFGLAALLHGSYDWLISLQPTFAAFIDIGAFVLFYAYVTKLRSLAGEAAPSTEPCSECGFRERAVNDRNGQQSSQAVVVHNGLSSRYP